MERKGEGGVKATVQVVKSFDDEKTFNKDYEPGDFLEFFKDEGKYLDGLADIVKDKGKPGEMCVVAYVVTLTK